MAEAEAMSSVAVATWQEWWRTEPVHAATASLGFSAAIWEWSTAPWQEFTSPSPIRWTIVSRVLRPFVCHLDVDGKPAYRGRLRPGDLFVHAEGAQPRAVNSGGGRVAHVYVPPRALEEAAGELGSVGGARLQVLERAQLRDPRIDQLTRFLADELAYPGRAGGALMLDALSVALAVALVRSCTNATTPKRGGPRLAGWQIRRATERLADDLASDVRLGELAQQCGLSPFHFARAFKSSVGMPPYRYQRHLRIERAKTLLTETNRSVTELAAEVGYESAQSFGRAFRQETGVSPSQYRRATRR